ncbi:MAG TPA: hypothetical protein DHV48_02280 [Prolixibacteraceae bacterium]|nr:hypothetical protein [Prolixibacteraceae bacterium]
MKTILFILIFPLAALLPGKELKAQIFDIKSWNGTYPDMNGTYPLTFIAFEGNLIPIPRVFIRTWPTHYYLEVIAVPASDVGEYSGMLKVNLMKIIERLIEKSQMKKRHEETTQIKNNTEIQRDIEKKIFDANSDQLPDVYSLASGFIRLYVSIANMDKLDNCKWLRQTYQKEADELLTRFISVNLFITDHGKKLEAFDEIRCELNKQIGETDYTYRKVLHLQAFNNNVPQSYAFLKD